MITYRAYLVARYSISFVVISSLCSVCVGQQPVDHHTVPELKGLFGSVPDKFRNYTVILVPDKNEPEWWAGAPSIARDKKGTFWLACRMRTAASPRGLRDYEIRILRSRDGINFEKVHSIRREDVPIPGFERRPHYFPSKLPLLGPA